MNLNYKIEIIEDETDGGFVVSCPELKGCVSCADSLDEALRRLEDAKREWFSACLDANIPVPEPLATE